MMGRSTVGVVLVLALALAGCGAGGAEPPSEGRGRLIESAYGEVSVPEEPRRIVTLDPVALINILALGEKPVGYATAGASGLGLVEEEVESVETVGSEAEPSVEKVAALEPDLIVGYAQNPDAFSEVAPIVDIPDYDETEWKRLFRFYGEALGKKGLAEEKISAFEERERDLRESLGAKIDDTTVSFVRFGQSDVSLYPTSFSGSVLRDVGIERPPGQEFEPGGECCVSVSVEELPKADADYVFVGVDPGGEKTLEEYEKNPLWARLEGEKIPVDPAVWIQPSYPTANAILDDLEEHLTERR